MSVKQELSKKYAQLCQELGDLIYKVEVHQNRITEIKKEIEVLNIYAPAFEQIEQSVVTQIKQAAQNERTKKD